MTYFKWDHMEPHSGKPQDEIYNLSYVLMCSDNWIWNTALSVQMVTGAVFLKRKTLHSSAWLFHSTAVYQRCGALFECLLPTCHVMARFPSWNQNLPMLQNMRLRAHEVWCSFQALCLCTWRTLAPISWTHSTCNWETLSMWISEFVFLLLWAYAITFFIHCDLCHTSECQGPRRTVIVNIQ